MDDYYVCCQRFDKYIHCIYDIFVPIKLSSIVEFIFFLFLCNREYILFFLCSHDASKTIYLFIELKYSFPIIQNYFFCHLLSYNKSVKLQQKY